MLQLVKLMNLEEKKAVEFGVCDEYFYAKDEDFM